MLLFKCSDGIAPLIETWDDFWVRDVRITGSLDRGSKTLAYDRKNSDWRQLYIEYGECCKKSFVCEKDL